MLITHLADLDLLDDATLATATELAIEGDAYRHLFRARRLARGARLRVVDGAGAARWGEVLEIDRRRAQVSLGEEAPANEPSYSLDLIVGAPRPERAAWLVEKATELGVVAIRFVASERTPRTYGDGTLERWRRVASSAVEQCHRARCPEVSGVHRWEEVPGLLNAMGESWMLDLETEWHAADQLVTRAASGAVLAGPEGGWSPTEGVELRALGAMPIGLGPRVFRVETAAFAMAALVLLGREHP